MALVDSLEYRAKWLRGAANDRPDFNAVKKSKDDQLLQNRLLLMMYEKLRTENIIIDKKGKETTILSVACMSTNENFSKYFLETFIDQVTAYYVDIKTERAKKNLEFIQKRTDSMRAAYQSTLYGRAVTSDANTNPNFQVTLVPQENQQTDVQILKAAYSELARSQEAAKTTLNRSTPLIQYLDRPTLPLRMNTSKRWLSFMLGLLGGMLLTSLFLLLRRAYRSIMGIQEKTGDEWMEEYADYNYPDPGSAEGDQPGAAQY
jgi:LPS O-antigen subunit length determinant protein (WzzB/FepE family)